MTAVDVDVASPVGIGATPQGTGGTGDATAGAAADHTVLGYWLSDASRTRLEDTGVGFTEDRAQVDRASVVVVSTRIPVGETLGTIAEVVASTDVPVLAIVHPGGEATGVRLLNAGAAGMIAEGNELSVVGFLGDGPDPAAFYETFEVSLDRRPDARRRAGTAETDPVTRLRGPGAMAARLAELDSVPRLGRVRIVGFHDVTRSLTINGKEFFRRRISDQFDQIVTKAGADIYSLGPADYAIVVEEMSVAQFEALAAELVAAGADFSPDRAGSLAIAIGHAGPEATSNLDTLVELTARCVGLAAELPDHDVVGSDKLAASLATTTELGVINAAIAEVEERDPYPGRHGERVARYAVAIAESLGVEGKDLATIRLAARYHDIGKLDLSDEAIAGMEDTLSGAELEAYKGHAARGAEMMRCVAGAAVAETIGAHHEHHDGAGFPKGLTADEIPVLARIVAVADALDRFSISGGAPDRPSPEAIQKLTELAGTRFDPTIVEAAVRVYGSDD